MADNMPVMDNMPVGSTGQIDSDFVRKAAGTLKKYKDGKAALEERVVANEEWYRLHHWDYIRRNAPDVQGKLDVEPTSARLFSVLMNKWADAMDNFPTQTALPREQTDESAAKKVSSVLPVVLQQNDYETLYANAFLSKLKHGTSVTAILWSNDKLNGLGDVDMAEIDILNIFWEPGISHIQKSKNVFVVSLVDNETIEDAYPHTKGKLSVPTISVKEYFTDDTIDDSGKSVVVDMYYRKRNSMGQKVLHYVKFVNDIVLYATENDTETPGLIAGQPAPVPISERGWYDDAVHPGRYPFVFDVLFPMKGSPAGFGMIDICRNPQMYIDKLDQAILKNAVIGARPRYFVRMNGAIDPEDFADASKDLVPVTGAGELNRDILPIRPPNLSSIYEQIRLNKIDEMNETAGARDFNQGGTTAGVTAASAIAALIETGSKTSRLINKASYRAHKERMEMAIERMRQFYSEPRYFRITGEDGTTQFEPFSNTGMAMYTATGQETGNHIPIFDLDIVPQKSSPFSTIAQNERAKELYAAGFFNPQMADQALAALDMMDFEGIDKVKRRISQNGTMLTLIQQQIGPLVLMMAQQIDATQSTQYYPQVLQILAPYLQGMSMPQADVGGEVQTDALGNAYSTMRGSQADKARVRAASASAPAS